MFEPSHSSVSLVIPNCNIENTSFFSRHQNHPFNSLFTEKTGIVRRPGGKTGSTKSTKWTKNN